MSSNDAIAGMIKGVLSWTEDKIKEYLTKFKHRDLAFIEDPQTITLAVEQRKKSEWDLFKKYIDDYDLRVLFQTGLTLRVLENTNKDRLESLRGRILKKHGPKGLHIAQFVQNGFFGKYIGNILERASTPEELKSGIKNLLNNIEKTCLFVNVRDDVEKRSQEAIIKINANCPETFIISSIGSAMKKCEKIKEKVMKGISGYTIELYKTDIKEIYFFNRSSPT